MATRHDQLTSFNPDAPLVLDYHGRRVRFVGTADIPAWVA
jgi:hypothetical protein